MDRLKRASLVGTIRELASTAREADTRVCVSLERFFDGNDDRTSMGCNLVDHPGLDEFRLALTELAGRSEVRAVAVAITDCMLEAEECWPFSDTIFVLTTALPEDLIAWIRPLKTDACYEWSDGPVLGIPEPGPGERLIAVSWD